MALDPALHDFERLKTNRFVVSGTGLVLHRVAGRAAADASGFRKGRRDRAFDFGFVQKKTPLYWTGEERALAKRGDGEGELRASFIIYRAISGCGFEARVPGGVGADPQTMTPADSTARHCVLASRP